MKIKFLRDALTSFLILSFFAFFGCKDDPCDNKDCGQYKTGCNDGECECPVGISKDSDGKCSIKDLDQVTKDWTLATTTSDCGISYPQGTKLIISEVTSSQQFDDIYVDFGGGSSIFPTLLGTISGLKITIGSQIISGVTYSGSGNLTSNGNVINLTITRQKSNGQICVFSMSGT